MSRAPEMNDVEWHQYHRLFRTHPGQYLRIAEDTIRKFPDDPQGYLDCVWVWMRAEEYDYALSDLNTALKLEDCQMTRLDLGIVLRCLGRFREAIEEFNRCEAMGAEVVAGIVHVNRAACHAGLGDLEAALADCALLSEDYFLPSLFGWPGGTKSQVTKAVRAIAAEAQGGQKASGQ
jgi:tetratricopeptide (TPR) repeat protein